MTAPVPPNALEAESAVLSAVLLSADALDDVADLLKPEHWYSDANRVVWDGVLSVMRAGQAVDVVTVANALRNRGDFGRCGGARYLAELVDATPYVANVRDHAKVVRDRWVTRACIAAAHKIAASGYAADDAGAYLDQSEQALFALTATDTSDDPIMLGDSLQVAAKHRAEIASGDRELLGITTGLSALDARLGGLQRGDLTILAARPGMGKSAAALGMALASSVYGWVSFHSLEMPHEQLANRFEAQRANLDLARLRRADLHDHEWSKLTAADESLSGLPILIDDSDGINLFQLRRTLRRVKRRALNADSELALVIVDYLQLMSPVGRERGRSREQEVSEISRGLKAIAKQLNVPVLALSQLSRKVEDRGGRRPQLSDLRESGALEQDADNVLFLYRSGYYIEQEGKDDDTGGVSEVIVAKQRNGPTGVVKVQWWSASASFSDLDQGY